MKFCTYYKFTRVSHGRFMPDVIEANSSAVAFKIAVKRLESTNIFANDLEAFYVTPTKTQRGQKYCMQIHGWDERGSLPRERWKKE